MAAERKIRRYTAYFQGWATAFGVHDKLRDEASGVVWLFGEDRLGLLATPSIKDLADALLPARRDAPIPEVELGSERLRIQDKMVVFGAGTPRVRSAAFALFDCGEDLHLHQTYHLVYPAGTRILTLSRQTPLPLVYREVEPIVVRFV